MVLSIPRIGIVGTGQLARMLSCSISLLGGDVFLLDLSSQVPVLCSFAVKVFRGDPDDYELLRSFASAVDVVVLETENVPLEALIFIESLGVSIFPSVLAIKVAQNRLLEKNLFRSLGLQSVVFHEISSEDHCVFSESLKFPALLKTARFGYDGRGQIKINQFSDLLPSWRALGSLPCVLEEFCCFDYEISVIVFCDGDNFIFYPETLNFHEHGILRHSIVPSGITPSLSLKAREAAQKIAVALDLRGILVVEFFVRAGGEELLVNEIAPRPHNSGHWTMNAPFPSQFQALAALLCGFPVVAPVLPHGLKIVMHNIIGAEIDKVQELFSDPSVFVYLYGKKEAHLLRKMGHWNKVQWKDGHSLGAIL